MDMYGEGEGEGGSPDYYLHSNNSHHHHLPPSNSNSDHHHDNFFSHFPSLHSDEAAELEWLSQFVDDTTSFFPDDIVIPNHNNNNNNENKKSSSSSLSSSSISHSHAPSTSSSTSSSGSVKSRSKRSDINGEGGMVVRRCSHCASEKTPQWRTGPMGPKTLCNACGVRFKSGRLVPEYRPASSPTFVLTQHSNSHRKVMELRRQKELLRQQQQQQHDFKVC